MTISQIMIRSEQRRTEIQHDRWSRFCRLWSMVSWFRAPHHHGSL